MSSPPRLELNRSRQEIAIPKAISRQYLLHHRVCPRSYSEDRSVLFLAIAPDALVDDCLTEIERVFGAKVEFEELPWSQVEAMIERTCAWRERLASDANPSDSSIHFEGSDSETIASNVSDVRNLATQPPVIRYVNLLLRDALEGRASDIHLEAGADGLIARIRIDGVLGDVSQPPSGLGAAVVSRIKLIAELDISERRRPQDGRIRVRVESREIDVRVSTVPTGFGESVVLRLLDGNGRPVGLEEIGMSQHIKERVGSLAKRPHGMMLVTGPTGSGKTTTLYACLLQRALHAEKVITVEDPIEYQLHGVTQVPVHRQAGVTFASALRSILRQDPDVVMIGEMRDSETAQIAVQAAMTGHLVLSTLHTNDAIGALPRLVDLGVPSYLVASTIEGILAQRLVRKICETCRVKSIPTKEQLKEVEHAAAEWNIDLGGDRVDYARGVGCKACRGTGFSGRIGLYELLLVNDELRDAVVRDVSRSQLRSIAMKSGMCPIRVDGYQRVRGGLTTFEEVTRVSQA